MSRIALAKLLVLAVVPVLSWGCGHDLDHCVMPVAITYGPAGAPPALSSCARFAVLSGSGVTCSGPSVTIDGDVGCSPSGNVNGVPSGQPTHGSPHVNDATSAAAQTSCTSAYTDLSARACNGTLSGIDLGGRTFSGGAYCFATSASLTGTLTLDAQGNADAVFVFQVGNDLTCANNSAVVLVGGAQASHVFWQVGNNASLGNNCTFKGTVIALSNVSCGSGSNLHGRALARNGTVTLNDCTVALP